MPNVTAGPNGNAPRHNGGRQRLGVSSPGENGGARDTITAGELLTFTVGTDASVTGRQWRSVLLRMDGTNSGATARVTFFDGATPVGQATASQTGIGEQLVDANGARFDTVVLTADSGQFGLKGFVKAAIFYFPQNTSSAQLVTPPTESQAQRGRRVLRAIPKWRGILASSYR